MRRLLLLVSLSILPATAQAVPSYHFEVSASASGSAVGAAVSSDDRYVALAYTGGVAVIDTVHWEALSVPTLCDGAISSVDFWGVDLVAGCDDDSIQLADHVQSSPPTWTAGTRYTLASESTASVEQVVVSDTDGVAWVAATASSDTWLRGVTLSDGTLVCDAILTGVRVDDLALDASESLYLAVGTNGGLTEDGGCAPSLLLQPLSSSLERVAADDVEGVWFLDSSGDQLIDESGLASIDDLGNPVDIAFWAESSLVSYAVTLDDAGLLQFFDLTADEVVATATAPNGGAALEVASDSDASLYVQVEGGGVSVFREAPIVTMGEDPDAIDTAGTASFSFSSTEAGSWEARLGGGVDRSGSLITNGTIAESEEVSFTVSGAESELIEGDNDILVFVSGTSGWGRNAGTLLLDTEPPAVDAPTTGFASGQVELSWTGIDPVDIDYYAIFVAEQDWDPSGAAPSWTHPDSTWVYSPDPAVDGWDADSVYDSTLGYPVAHQGDGVEHTFTLAGLTDGVTYYLALAAVDLGGAMGPVGTPVAVVPQDTVGAAGLAGDGGGCNGTAATGDGSSASDAAGDIGGGGCAASVLGVSSRPTARTLLVALSGLLLLMRRRM